MQVTIDVAYEQFLLLIQSRPVFVSIPSSLYG
jgi:hypothetical protein